MNIVEIYVEKVFVSHQFPEVQGELSRMLDLDNESTGFMSPVPHIPHVDMPTADSQSYPKTLNFSCPDDPSEDPNANW